MSSFAVRALCLGLLFAAVLVLASRGGDNQAGAEQTGAEQKGVSSGSITCVSDTGETLWTSPQERAEEGELECPKGAIVVIENPGESQPGESPERVVTCMSDTGETLWTAPVERAEKEELECPERVIIAVTP